jgi:hypothetical protein
MNAVAVLGAAVPVSAQIESGRDRQVPIVVSFFANGGVEFIARTLTERVGKLLLDTVGRKEALAAMVERERLQGAEVATFVIGDSAAYQVIASGRGIRFSEWPPHYRKP